MVIADAAFERFIASTELPVVVDFWAAWCGPCKAMAPQFENLARAMPLVRFIKVDTDAAPLASAKYNIRSIPSLLLFEGGKEKARITGAMSAQDLKAWLQAHLSPGAPL
jgi:thioredoxin 2